MGNGLSNVDNRCHLHPKHRFSISLVNKLETSSSRRRWTILPTTTNELTIFIRFLIIIPIQMNAIMRTILTMVKNSMIGKRIYMSWYGKWPRKARSPYLLTPECRSNDGEELFNYRKNIRRTHTHTKRKK